jgi:hypothetical protein
LSVLGDDATKYAQQGKRGTLVQEHPAKQRAAERAHSEGVPYRPAEPAGRRGIRRTAVPRVVPGVSTPVARRRTLGMGAAGVTPDGDDDGGDAAEGDSPAAGRRKRRRVTDPE